MFLRKKYFEKYSYSKVYVRYVLRNLYFSPNGSPSKTMKDVFLFHIKSSFRSWDTQIFVSPPSPLVLPVSHWLRAWSRINLKVYDVINCLNKNLITNFVWYLEKEKRYDIETLAIDKILNKEHFMEKSCRKWAPKASPRSLFSLKQSKSPKQPLHARNSFKNTIFWKGIIKKL